MLAPLTLCFPEEAPSKRRCYLKEAAPSGGLFRHPAVDSRKPAGARLIPRSQLSGRWCGLLVRRQQAHLDGFVFGYRVAHRAIESLAGRKQRLHTGRRWIGAVFAAGTDRISSEADNHCTEQNSSNDIIAVHGGDPRSPPPQQQPAPAPVPFKKLAGESGIRGLSGVGRSAPAHGAPALIPRDAILDGPLKARAR
jgi:hypothetical protein